MGPPLPPASQAFRSASQRSRPEVKKNREGRRSVQVGAEGIDSILATFGVEYVSREGAPSF